MHSIYANHANLCESFDLFESNLCEYIRSIRIESSLIDSNRSNRSNIFDSNRSNRVYENIFNTNMPFHIRINPHIFGMRIYADLSNLSNACEFIECMRIYANRRPCLLRILSVRILNHLSGY